MVRVLGRPFVGGFSRWTYSDPRALGWISDAATIARVEYDPLSVAVLGVYDDLRSDRLLPVGPRGVGYVLLGTTIGAATGGMAPPPPWSVVKTKTKVREDLPKGLRERAAALVAFYDFPDIGDTITALRRCHLLDGDDVEDGRTECISPLVAVNADDVRRTLIATARAFGPDLLADQSVFTEMWCEAQGLARAVGNVLAPYGIEVYSGSGDVPLDAIECAAERYERALEDGKGVVVSIIGDRDIDGIENADRFRADVEAHLPAHLRKRIVWRWVAPLRKHLGRWPDLRSAVEPGKTRGSKSLSWTMQAEALLRGNVLATIIREEVESVLDPHQVTATRARWNGIEVPTIERQVGRRWR